MAISQAHKLGELIGLFFEEAMKEPIASFARAASLYFDTRGTRKARKGKKVSWTDINGNRHDLDYVLERGGSNDKVGEPVAFIELAWRRYTKHSKNKAQEIAGAVNPIAERYSQSRPFKGAILSGDFTITSLEQLRSEGFFVLYIPFKKIVGAFAEHGLDIYFDERTSETKLQAAVRAWKKTSRATMEAIRSTLFSMCDGEIAEFVTSLRTAVDRRLKYVFVIPLYGRETELKSITAAIDYILSLPASQGKMSLRYVEVVVGYTDGTKIDCQFPGRSEAVAFLRSISK